MRMYYWSGSKFADFLRGTTKPQLQTSTGWRNWEKLAKATHPFRYWLAEEGLDKLQDFVNFIPDKFHLFFYYLRKRFVYQTHALVANPCDIKPGQYADLAERILYCLFNELQNYVEISLALKYCACDPVEERKYKRPWWNKRPFIFGVWRSADAGLAHLNWEISLTYDTDWGMSQDDERLGMPTNQAIAAKEVLELYNWWVNVFRNRSDPMDASGWSAYCAKYITTSDIFDDGSNLSPELQEFRNIAHKKLGEIEKQYSDENTEMLIRLIKIRECLWT